MFKQYYFLTSSFPELSLKDAPTISFEDLKHRFQLNLAKGDYEKLKRLRMFIDIQNLRLMWLLHPIDTRGNLTIKELESALLAHDFFPEYVFDFLRRHEEVNYRLVHFPYLISKFFQEEALENHSFLTHYFKMERELRLIFTALRAKQMKRDIVYELQYEDPKDDLVAYILAQKDMDNFEAPQEYAEIVQLFHRYQADPLRLHKHLIEYKIKRLDEMTSLIPFSIDSVLAYTAKLMLIEDWHALDQEEGDKALESLA